MLRRISVASIIACPVAHRARFTTCALLVACACLGPWPHRAGAAEISAESVAKGFADLVAKVKPAVISVTVSLESDPQFSSRSHFPGAHRSIATSLAALSGSSSRNPHRLGRSKWPWGRAVSYPLTGMR